MILTYIIKVLICSGVLYTYFTLALKNSTLHRWNRIFLLLAPLVSLFLPPVKFPVAHTPVMQVLQLKMITLQPAKTNAPALEAGSLLYILYIIIATCLVARVVWTWWRLYNFAAKGHIQQQHGYTLIQHESVLSTFSFFNRIFYNEPLSPDSPVLRHELAHVHGFHTLDKIWMEVLCAVCWCNPFFYLMKRDLAMVHEYIADQEAAAGAPTTYAKILLQMALQTQYLPGSSQFAQSPMKRRISMLFIHKSNNTIMKKMIMFPVAAMLLVFMGSQQADIAVAAVPHPVSDTDKVYTLVDNPPEFPTGLEGLTKFMIENVHYPKTAQDAKKEGVVFVQFKVGVDGTISNVKTVNKSLGYGLEEESIRVVHAMPKWKPGTNKGEKVAVIFNLPIKYDLKK